MPRRWRRSPRLPTSCALPVVQSEARDIGLPTDHAMCLGSDRADVGKADVLAVFDSAVPWIRRAHGLRRDAKVICSARTAVHPLSVPRIRGDLLVTGKSCATFIMLREALRSAVRQDGAGVAARRKAVAAMREEMLGKRRKLLAQVKSASPVHPLYLAHCLNELKAKDAIIVNEVGLPAAGLELTTPRSYLGSSLAGGLGFGLGGGLGAKLAAPEREVIAASATAPTTSAIRSPITMSAAPRSCRRSPSSPTTTPGARCARRPATSIPTATPPRPTPCRSSSSTRRRPSRWSSNPAAATARRSRRRSSSMPALRRGFEAIRSGTPALVNVATQNRM